MKVLSKKIILLGSQSVGKTSLVNKYVHNKFSETYVSTIGVRIERKELVHENVGVNMIIWDLAGEEHQRNTPQSYFLGASGVIFVCDLSSPPSFLDMDDQIELIKKKIPNVPILVASNKADLLSDQEIVETISMMPNKPAFLTSAKTGDKVEELFAEMAKLLTNQ